MRMQYSSCPPVHSVISICVVSHCEAVLAQLAHTGKVHFGQIGGLGECERPPSQR